jgi:hypothetical protein
VQAKLFGDALGAHGSLIVHPPGPGHTREQGAALMVAERGGLDGVLLLLARDERFAPGAPCLWASDLDFRAVHADLDAFGPGVGEQVLQRADPQARAVGDGEAASREQGPDLADRGGESRAVDLEQLGQGGVRQPEAQVDKGGQQPVGNTSPLFAPRAHGAPPGATTSLTQRGLAGRFPLGCGLFEQLAGVCARDPGQGRTGAGRTGPGQLHNSPNL